MQGVAKGLIRLALVKVRPDLIGIEVISRVMSAIGILPASTGTLLPDTPEPDFFAAFRCGFPLAVMCLAIVGPDALRVGDADPIHSFPDSNLSAPTHTTSLNFHSGCWRKTSVKIR